jgi:ABC-type glycerol-3-phosphate transport system substrate-binding protein
MFKKAALTILLILLVITSSSTIFAEEFDVRQYEGTTLNVLLKTGYETAGIEKFAHEFEDITGIEINYEVYDEPTMRRKFIMDATTQSGEYDVVATQFWHFPEYQRAGWLEPISDIGSEADLFNFDLDSISEAGLETFTSNGELYAIPVSFVGGVLIYREDIFEKHNLEIPQTVEDVMQTAEKLKDLEPDLYPFAARGTSGFASFGTSVGWAWAYGAKIIDGQEVTIDTPEMKEAMTDFVNLMSNYGPPGQATIGWQQASELYRKGKIIMNFDMGGFPVTYNNPEVSDVAGKIDVAHITGPADEYTQWLYSEGLSINKYSENKEAAKLFIQWRTGLDTAVKEAEAQVRIDFPDERVYEKESYNSAVKEQNLEFWADKLPEHLAAINPEYWPFTPKFTQIADAFQSEISSAISGEQSVEEALENAQAKVEKIY